MQALLKGSPGVLGKSFLRDAKRISGFGAAGIALALDAEPKSNPTYICTYARM